MPKEVTLEELADVVKKRTSGTKPTVITISGFGGSGKTTIATKLAKLLGQADIVHVDDFIVDRLTTHTADWDDLDWQRLIAEVLTPISKGSQTIEYGIYNWQENVTKEKRTVHLQKYVIVEGVGLLKEDLKQYFDISIWIDVALETATARAKERDAGDNEALWDQIWTANDRNYYEKHQPKSLADFTLINH